MARTRAALPPGSRITDYISLGVMTRWFPRHKVDGVLRDCGRASRRQRDLPAHVMVYYVIALALFMQSSYREVLLCLLEGLQWLQDPATALKVAGDSGISQARSRLGVEPIKRLHDELIRPLATAKTRGSFYRQWRLEVLERFADGSYRSAIYASQADWRRRHRPLPVRVIEYRLEGIDDAEPFYRLVTTILDPQQAPAVEMAALYGERWEIENALDELKTHLRGARIVLRSKTPELVRQEFYGLMMAHFAIRGLLHEAALRADEDPDRLSYLHAVRVVRRKMARVVAIPPCGQESIS